jgi:hypothetical protein
LLVNLSQDLFQVDPVVYFFDGVGVERLRRVNIGDFGDLVDPLLHAFGEFVDELRIAQLGELLVVDLALLFSG